MTKGPILLTVTFIANVVLAFFLTTVYLENQGYIQCDEKSKQLSIELFKSKKLLKKKTDEMSACVKAVIGAESDFDPLFHSVEEASLMEVTVYSDTESGEPRKFVIRGCKSGPE